MKYSQNMPFYFLYTMVQKKKVKNDQKLKSRVKDRPVPIFVLFWLETGSYELISYFRGPQNKITLKFDGLKTKRNFIQY